MNEIFIKIEGLNLYRIIQKLVDGGVMVSNLKLKKSYVLFSINERFMPKLKSICKRERKKIYVVKNTKIKRFFAKLPYMIGGFLPILFLFAFFYSVHNTIFSVSLSYNSDSYFDLTTINKLLLDNNISTGAKRSDMSIKEIEKLILENANDVAGCEVFYEGQNLNIVIFPAEIKIKNDKTDLLSKYNAVITSIETFAGDAMVKKNQLVKAGDVLIKYNDGAQGEVFGKVYFSSMRIYSEKRDIMKETGNVYEESCFSLANLIPLGKVPICEYENFEVEKSSQVIVENLFIPIVKERYIFKEIALVEEFVPFEDVGDEIKQQLKAETLKKLPEGASAENITYSVVADGNFVRIDCFVETVISLI